MEQNKRELIVPRLIFLNRISFQLEVKIENIKVCTAAATAFVKRRPVAIGIRRRNLGLKQWISCEKKRLRRMMKTFKRLIKFILLKNFKV